MMRKIQEPKITMIDGTNVFPNPLEAAMEQSINAETQYDKDIMLSLFNPASITFSSVAKRLKNGLPAAYKQSPITSPIIKA